MNKYIEVGQLVTTHGVAGEMKLYPWADSPDALLGLKTLFFGAEGQRPMSVKVRRHGQALLVKAEGIDSPEAARPYMQREVWALREEIDLPAGRYFIADLLGCQVRDAQTGRVYGVVKNVENHGAGDIYTIEDENGRETLFPAVPRFLEALRPEEGLILIRPIEGMFDDAN